MSEPTEGHRQAERRGPGRPKGGRRLSDPILDLKTHPARYVCVSQLAAYWGKHKYTLNGYIRDGKLTAVRIGCEYRIAVADALAFEQRDRQWHKRPA